MWQCFGRAARLFVHLGIAILLAEPKYFDVIEPPAPLEPDACKKRTNDGPAEKAGPTKRARSNSVTIRAMDDVSSATANDVANEKDELERLRITYNRVPMESTR